MTMSAIRNVSLAVAGLALLAGCQTSSTAPGAGGGAQELAAAYYACMLDAYAASPNAVTRRPPLPSSLTWWYHEIEGLLCLDAAGLETEPGRNAISASFEEKP